MGEEGRVHTEIGREGKKECTSIFSCDFTLCVFFFFFFYKALAWLQVCSLRLLATFSKPTHSSLFFWLCVIQQHTFPYTFFFFFFLLHSCDVWVEFLPLFHAVQLRATCGEADSYFELSKRRWIDGINSRGCWCCGASECTSVLTGKCDEEERGRGEGERLTDGGD